MMMGLFGLKKRINDDRFICFWDKVMVGLSKFYVVINDDRFICFWDKVMVGLFVFGIKGWSVY